MLPLSERRVCKQLESPNPEERRGGKREGGEEGFGAQFLVFDPIRMWSIVNQLGTVGVRDTVRRIDTLGEGKIFNIDKRDGQHRGRCWKATDGLTSAPPSQPCF